MNKQERKAYNDNYYLLKKEEIIAKQAMKTTCPICNRSVGKCRLKQHLMTKLCGNTANFNKFLESNQKNI